MLVLLSFPSIFGGKILYIEYKKKVLMAQIIKYSVRKGGNVKFNPLINILKAIDNDDVKSEIIYALGYKINNSKELL